MKANNNLFASDVQKNDKYKTQQQTVHLAKEYPDVTILQQLVAKLPWGHYAIKNDPQKSQHQKPSIK
jgi:hypothetical protein